MQHMLFNVHPSCKSLEIKLKSQFLLDKLDCLTKGQFQGYFTLGPCNASNCQWNSIWKSDWITDPFIQLWRGLSSIWLAFKSEIACFLIAFDGRSWGKGLRWCYYWVVRISLIKGGDRDTKNGKVGLRRVGFCCSQSLDPLLMWINRAGSLSSWYANASYLLSLLGTSDGDKRHINEMGEKFPDAAAFLRWKRLAQEKGKNLPRFTGVPARC